GPGRGGVGTRARHPSVKTSHVIAGPASAAPTVDPAVLRLFARAHRVGGSHTPIEPVVTGNSGACAAAWAPRSTTSSVTAAAAGQPRGMSAIIAVVANQATKIHVIRRCGPTRSPSMPPGP